MANKPSTGHRLRWVGIALAVAGVAAVAIWLLLSNRAEAPQGTVTVDPKATPNPATPVAYRVEPVVGGLYVPWDIQFTSATRWLVTERSGAIRIIQNGVLQPAPLATFAGISARSEEGLMGLALHPDYGTNRLVYTCYARPTGGGLVDRVVRFEDRGTSIGPETVIIDNLPAATNHAGCRLAFGPDQKLYITTGDATNRKIAQDPASLGGKILRVNADGSIPADNPTAGSAVWSLGHRNAQGIAWQPGTGRLFATEHGPSGFDGPGGGDEVNIISKGANFGWPVVSHERTDPQFVSPLLVFTPAVAPGGAMFYTGTAIPQFTGNLFFAALKGEGVMRVELTAVDSDKVARYTKLPEVNVGRVRHVAAGPDGAIYLLTSNRDGRGSPKAGDDQIFRIVPNK